jgi:hypothetical protein
MGINIAACPEPAAARAKPVLASVRGRSIATLAIAILPSRSMITIPFGQASTAERNVFAAGMPSWDELAFTTPAKPGPARSRLPAFH